MLQNKAIGNKWLISPTFYAQLWRASKILKLQKDSDDLIVFSRFWDLHTKKLRENMLVKSTQGCTIHAA